MYIYANPNPLKKHVGDCVVRAISIAENITWRTCLLELTAYSYFLYELISSNSLWPEYLLDAGYTYYTLPNTCPFCYTLKQFCYDHPFGTYIACTGSHIIAVIDGDYYDTWDSGDEVVTYYFRKGNI